MTPSARDRAIETAYKDIVTADPDDGAMPLQLAAVVIDGLIARPDVLRALAGTPAEPTTDEESRWREHERVVGGGYCGNEFPRLWPPAPVAAPPAPAAEPATPPIDEIVDDLVGIWHDDPEGEIGEVILHAFLGLREDEITPWGRDGVIPRRLHDALRELHRKWTGAGAAPTAVGTTPEAAAASSGAAGSNLQDITPCAGAAPPNEWAAESTRIANRGCACTEEETCWDHEALEMRAEHARACTAPGDTAAGGGRQ